jgi:hypothetical protein
MATWGTEVFCGLSAVSAEAGWLLRYSPVDRRADSAVPEDGHRGWTPALRPVGLSFLVDLLGRFGRRLLSVAGLPLLSTTSGCGWARG